MAGLLYLYWPITRAFYEYRVSLVQKPYVPENEVVNIMPPKIRQIKQYFGIQIPKILAGAEVESVPPFNRQAYMDVLDQNKIARADNSGWPGDGKGKSMYLFAHSSQQNILAARNNPVFYLLGELKNGDPIFIEKDEVVYTYVVYDRKVVGADEIGYINYSDPENEVLILQTCWPIGTNWRRLLVFAKRIK